MKTTKSAIRMVTSFMPDGSMAWHVTIYGTGASARFMRAFGEHPKAKFEPITESAFLELCAFAHYIGWTVLYTVARTDAPFLYCRVKINGLQAQIDAAKQIA